MTQGEGWMSVAMTPGSSHVVIGGWDKLVRLIEVKSGTECARMAFGNRVTSVYISHGGRHLTVATDGGDMRIIDGRWLEVAETAIPAWQSALRFQSQSRLNAGGKLVTLSAAELVEAGSEVDAFLKQEMTAARSWQRRVVEWGRTPPLGRTLSPWSTEMMWKAAGQTFMQLNPAQKSAMAQCVDSAPWHPLAPLTVARLEVPAEGEPEASAKAKMPQHKHLALLTLKRLRNADERVYERESLAEYALWTARVIQQELGLEEEALDALELQIRWAPQEKQVELQARLDRLIAALAKENSTKDGSGKQPVAFRFQYAAEPDPGPRVWMRSGDVWEERSPSGAAKRLRVIGRGEADGRAGTIAQEMTNPGFEV
ncbi:MAG TPA: hypothetical protein VD994_11715, partial [Prosthecobacter sp.]|nr:hypothetical protein [Prosthecobacter sp.]